MAKKLMYKIGEACRELDIQPYVLRYWETEFPLLKPDKSSSGQRVYSEDELAIIRRIKELLYDEGYTIAGAKKKLEAEMETGGPKTSPRKTTHAESESSPSDDEKAEETAPEGNGDAEPPAQQTELDTAADERIQTIVRGLRELRDETREILEILRG